MYYTGSGSTQVNRSLWDQWVSGSVTSTDTLDWKYPEDYEQRLFARRFLEGEVVDPTEQAEVFDSIFAIGACVMKEGATYRCWYTGWNGEFEHAGGGVSKEINHRIGYATSADGVAWTKVQGNAGAGAVLGLGIPGEPDAKGAGHPHVIKDGGTYRMWYEGYDGSRWRILRATSSDGVVWNKQGIALGTGNSGAADELGLRNPVVILRGGQYELWYEGRGASSPNYRVMRATSPDGVTWSKAGEVALHPPIPDAAALPGWERILLAGDERIYVDSILVQQDDACQVFFARQFTVERDLTYGTIRTKQSHIFTEVVDP
jgi:hypothetical protein